VLALSCDCCCVNRIEELEQRLVQAVGDAKEANDLRYVVNTVLLYDVTVSHPLCVIANSCHLSSLVQHVCTIDHDAVSC
jgi:hypothetical protein